MKKIAHSLRGRMGQILSHPLHGKTKGWSFFCALIGVALLSLSCHQLAEVLHGQMWKSETSPASQLNTFCLMENCTGAGTIVLTYPMPQVEEIITLDLDGDTSTSNDKVCSIAEDNLDYGAVVRGCKQQMGLKQPMYSVKQAFGSGHNQSNALNWTAYGTHWSCHNENIAKLELTCCVPWCIRRNAGSRSVEYAHWCNDYAHCSADYWCDADGYTHWSRKGEIIFRKEIYSLPPCCPQDMYLNMEDENAEYAEHGYYATSNCSFNVDHARVDGSNPFCICTGHGIGLATSHCSSTVDMAIANGLAITHDLNLPCILCTGHDIGQDFGHGIGRLVSQENVPPLKHRLLIPPFNSYLLCEFAHSIQPPCEPSLSKEKCQLLMLFVGCGSSHCAQPVGYSNKSHTSIYMLVCKTAMDQGYCISSAQPHSSALHCHSAHSPFSGSHIRSILANGFGVKHAPGVNQAPVRRGALAICDIHQASLLRPIVAMYHACPHLMPSNGPHHSIFCHPWRKTG